MTTRRPLTSREEAERLVRQHFPRQVEACEELLELSWEMLGATPWRGRASDGNMVDKLIAWEGARGLKTYRGAMEAALGGFGPQAAMMNRALFEGMAMAHWVRRNPTLAVERFDQHLRHNRGIWNKRLISRAWLDEPLDRLPDEKEQAKLDGLFGRWGDKLWCGLTLHRLVQTIEEEWEDGFNRTELWDFFVIVHAHNNETLHTSATSLTSGVLRDNAATLDIDAGPSLHQVEHGLLGALWSYTNLLRVTSDHFEIDGRDQIEEVSRRCRATFRRIDPTVQRQTGRNDPCPCGSGQKFKRCHGR